MSVPSRAARIVLAVIAAALMAAGCEPAATPRREPATTLDSLRALGYADWDEDADPAQAGVTRHDRELASPGVQLFTDEESTVRAVAMDGSAVHTWHVPEWTRCEHVELLPQGRIAVLSVDEGVSVLEPNGDVVWSRAAAAHHDIAPLASGELLVPVHDEHEYAGRIVRFDSIARVGPSDTQLVWSSRERMQELSVLHPPTPLDRPAREMPDQMYDYYHLNSVEVLPPSTLAEADDRFRAGNLLVCLRNVNLILVLDASDGAVLWHWGPGELDAPHMPSLTPDGTILVFDNGRHRGWSRVLEVDPRAKAITWQWRADPPESFYTELRGSAQRLANGNTLVCESERGRAFEVTRGGEIVWEFWNVLLEGKRRRIYRMTRVTVDEARGFR
ncbi:MAG: hypothetical protein GY711_27355 [bacterium]|nr:hypothetical protein [bacterium]